MKSTITQVLIAAWLNKNASELAVLPGDEKARNEVVGNALGASVPYFESHPERETFLITTDGQAFYDDEANQHIATQHALSLKEPNLKIVLRVHRSDVQDVLNAPKGAATAIAESNGNDYGSMTKETLQKLCTEKGISYNDKTTKAQLIQLLLDNVGTVNVEKPAEDEPEVEEAVEVEETASVNYEAMTVKELTAEAEKLGIIVIKDWKKADLIKAIEDTVAAKMEAILKFPAKA